MDKVFLGPSKTPPPAPPRFSLGRAAGGGLVACLWLWTSATGALAADASAAPADPTAYQSALDRFNHQDYARALTLLDRAPTNGSPADQADVSNLRGAIYLRQERYDRAQGEFARAARLDHGLWAARFNAAEVSFRQGHYAESRRQFAALLDGTNRLFHHEEYRFVQYKLLLAGICAGDEKPALDYIADHRDDDRPPLAWYYLNAALEHRHDRAPKSDQWLAQADARFAPGSGQTYADSFARLGWGNGRAGSAGVTEPWRATHAVAMADNTVTKAPAARARPASTAGAFDGRNRPTFHDAPPDPVALPDDRPGFSTGVPPEPAARPPGFDRPLAADEMVTSADDTVRAENNAAPALFPSTLARARKSRSTPAPAPDATPTGVTANQGGPTPTPAASPAGSPTPEFTERYEAAYVKFLEKNYPDTLSLLDEADKIQAGQPQSVSLRFKAHYALAYIEYRKQNYPGALTQLDQADQTQKNADSFNLRGLIFSKQHNYDQAEMMFHRAVTTDPALWAAKFNYAELPFNRGNYTDARTRFEELFSLTDATKQPREAELTQYKVFLTLLLEGKVEAASTFMDHLNFSGATPARYFCNAALNFRAGSVDRAKTWIDDAKKEYPPQLVAIFIESFYRLGWMADPNAPPGTMVAQATPVGTPAVTTSGTLPTTVTTATAAPTPVPSATPIVVAAASPTPTPLATPVASVKPSPAVVVLATPTPTASIKPSPAVVAAASPTPTPTPIASATPRLTATATAMPAIAVATPTPTATAARPVALASVSPAPLTTATPVLAMATPVVGPVRPVVLPTAAPTVAASVPPVVVATATPARSVPALATATPVPSASRPPTVASATPMHTATPTPTAVTQVTPAPSATPANAVVDASAAKARHKRLVHIVVLALVLVQTLFYLMAMLRMLSRRKQRAMRAAARRREAVESSK